MAMSLSKVKAKVAQAQVAWEDEVVDFGYHPGEVTPALLETVQGAADKGDLDVIGALLEPVLAWWDVLDDEDQRLPTDKATIRQVPLGFLMEVLGATQEAMRPPEDAT
jgi:hypothetical protein